MRSGRFVFVLIGDKKFDAILQRQRKYKHKEESHHFGPIFNTCSFVFVRRQKLIIYFGAILFIYKEHNHHPHSFSTVETNSNTFLVINSKEVIWLLPRVSLRTAFLIVCCFPLTGSLLKIPLMLLCLHPVPRKTLRPRSSKHPQALPRGHLPQAVFFIWASSTFL